jgi:hypothetical protein
MIIGLAWKTDENGMTNPQKARETVEVQAVALIKVQLTYLIQNRAGAQITELSRIMHDMRSGESPEERQLVAEAISLLGNGETEYILGIHSKDRHSVQAIARHNRSLPEIVCGRHRLTWNGTRDSLEG